jgi:hypothetical protein
MKGNNMTKTKKKTQTTCSTPMGNSVSVGGVYFDNAKNKYVARFTLNGVRKNVGSFNSERSAKSALKAARNEYIA